MVEAGRWLTSVVSAGILITGCSGSNQGHERSCLKNSAEVAGQVGGNSKDWGTLKGRPELLEYKGISRTVAGPQVGSLWVYPSDGGAPKYLLSGEEEKVDNAIYRCIKDDEINLSEPPKILPEK